MNKIQILDFFKMTNCICGHDVSWHWMDMHRKGRCVYRIAEMDACHCKKYVKDEDQENELTIEHSSSRKNKRQLQNSESNFTCSLEN